MNPTLNIIHLPHRIDRWELLQRELVSQEITNYKIWEGVVHPQATFAGISSAHKRIVREAKTMGLPYVLIGEDDLRFTAPGAFRYFLDHVPEDYDLYLASIYIGTIKEDNTVRDFSGLTLYLVNERFYDVFLGVKIMNHLDRELAGRGRFVVVDQFCAVQYTTYSDNSKGLINNQPLLNGRRLFNNGK